MVHFDRWASLMLVVVVLAWLFRDEVVRIIAVEQPVGAAHDNVVEFGKRGAA